MAAPLAGPAGGPARGNNVGLQTGAAHLAKGQQLEAQGRLDEASKEFDAAAEQFRAEGKLSESVDARQRSAKANEKLIAQAGVQVPSPRPAPGPGAAPAVAPAPLAAPAPAAPAAPVAPAGPATGGLPSGTYNCHGLAPNGIFAVIRRVIINGNAYVYHTLNDREKLPGTYRRDGTNVTWLTGPLTARAGEFKQEPDKSSPVLIVLEGNGAAVTAFRCFLSGG